jgi:hypothetical protein
MVQEVTIRVEDAFIDPWGLGIGDPPRAGGAFPPVLVFIADDVHLALRQGLTTWPNGGTLEVDRAGFAAVTHPGCTPAKYELFPAKFDDDKPYEPLCYIGKWPD